VSVGGETLTALRRSPDSARVARVNIEEYSTTGVAMAVAAMTAQPRTAAFASALADPPIRVLVVVDKMLVRAGVRGVLERVPDIEIVGEAESGEEAGAMVGRWRPDVIVMSLDLPGGGGISVTRTLTAQETHPSVLVLTVHPEAEQFVEALRAGASGYITEERCRAGADQRGARGRGR
jgi:CheY-like chemotaxis protein